MAGFYYSFIVLCTFTIVLHNNMDDVNVKQCVDTLITFHVSLLHHSLPKNWLASFELSIVTFIMWFCWPLPCAFAGHYHVHYKGQTKARNCFAVCMDCSHLNKLDRWLNKQVFRRMLNCMEWFWCCRVDTVISLSFDCGFDVSSFEVLSCLVLISSNRIRHFTSSSFTATYSNCLILFC